MEMKTAAQIRRDATDAQILAARFPNMSRATREANEIPSGEAVAGNREGKVLAAHSETKAAPVNTGGSGGKATDLTGFTLRIEGQCSGGKNAMGINHTTGRHYARPKFKTWRDDAVEQILRQLPTRLEPIATPVNVRLAYVAGDRRRRDFPAICDALWHVLEKAGVVTDDALLWPAESSRSYDKSAPSCAITFL